VQKLSRRVLTALGAAATAVVLTAGTAYAHPPVMLDESDRLPWRAPLVVDGTDAIAMYGVLPHPGAVRSAQYHFTAGQPLIVSLLIPDLAPENSLPASRLPVARLVAPNGSVTFLRPDQRVTFVDPDSGRHLMVLHNLQSTSIGGTYSVVVTGRAPARFIISTGVESEAFHGLRRAVVASDEEADEWYATAP
jgi:hypothetical protein